MSDLILIAALLVWIPMIPLRLAIQGGIGFWRKIGDLAYLIFFVYWGAVDLVVIAKRQELLSSRMETGPLAGGAGYLLVVLSLVFGYWTASTLGFLTFTTRPQVTPKKIAAPLIISGPYRYLRHPFYFSEWFLLSGAALITGSWLIAGLVIVAILIDPFVTVLEEKELVARFGNDYLQYQKRVPRLLPTLAPLFRKGGP